MNAHAGAKVCAIEKDVIATLKEGMVTATLINRAFDEEKTFVLENTGEVAESKLYTSDDVVPGTAFEIKALELNAENGKITCKLPPHSIAVIRTKAI